MEVTSSTVYWIMQLDRLCGAAVILALLSGIGFIYSIFMVISAVDDEVLDKDKGVLICSGSLLVFLLFFVVAVFMPDTRTAISMYCIPKALNGKITEQLQGDAKELYTLGIEKLKAELKGNKEKEK